MKKIKLFIILLLLTALLCGCMAANPGSTAPTDGPTTPTTTPTQPTEPQPTDPPPTEPKPLEPLTIQGYHSGSFPGLKYKDEYGVVIRSVRELRAVNRADLTGKLAEYDDAFFEENSLIVISCGHGSGINRHFIIISDIVELGENRYEIQVDHYDDNPLTWDMWDHGTFAEVNRVIEEDAEIAVKLRYFDSIMDHEIWKMMFESDSDIDYTALGEPVPFNLAEMDGDIGDLRNGTKYIRTVSDLEDFCKGQIPEELSKYDESYFTDSSLYLVRKKNYMDFTFPEISHMADGNYLIRAEYFNNAATMSEDERAKTTLYILEIDEKFPEDVKPIWLQARIFEFDMAEGLKLQ
jgi:hypothetical protein